MKIVLMHIKIFLCIVTTAVLLGIVTVTPCAQGKKCSVLSRSYGFDKNRFNELADKVKNLCCKCCSKKDNCN